MRSFVRFALQALILLVVAMVSALTAMRLAIHGREVSVPDVVGKTPVEARRISEGNGFQFEVERQYYSPTMPEGKILSQLPPAGTLIRRGWRIRVAQSLGPQRVEIPNVLGQSQRAAEINIRRRGLDVGAVAKISLPEVPVDQVVAQSPAPSAGSISAPKISLLAADTSPPQAFVMPSFVGETLGTATAAVKEAGFKLGSVTLAQLVDTASSPEQSPTFPISPTSIISSQHPAAGERIVAGDAVSFEVH
jgi:eukaryotic-like serine/threonine-protein kinase